MSTTKTPEQSKALCARDGAGRRLIVRPYLRYCGAKGPRPGEGAHGRSAIEPNRVADQRRSPETNFAQVDVAIVGSGYGGSNRRHPPRGAGSSGRDPRTRREYAPGDFPVDLGHAPGHVRFHRADADDQLGIRTRCSTSGSARPWTSWSANGLGGTSLSTRMLPCDLTRRLSRRGLAL